MSKIIAANPIEVPDPPKVQSVDLIQQIMENISAQIALLDGDIFAVQQQGGGVVRFVSIFILCIFLSFCNLRCF